MKFADDESKAPSVERFPLQMRLVDDVFQFRHDAANEVSSRIASVNELLSLIEAARLEVRDADISEAQKQRVAELIFDETTVVGFSLSARGSVIQL